VMLWISGIRNIGDANSTDPLLECLASHMLDRQMADELVETVGRLDISEGKRLARSFLALEAPVASRRAGAAYAIGALLSRRSDLVLPWTGMRRDALAVLRARCNVERDDLVRHCITDAISRIEHAAELDGMFPL